METRSNTEAIAISEAMLQITGDALMSGDFASFAQVFNLPQLMSVADKQVRVETSDELRTLFDMMHKHFRDIGVTDLHRVCELAEFDGPDTIRATHITSLLSHGSPLQDPYPVISRLVRTSTGWKIGGADYDLDPNSGQADAILRSQDTNAATGRLAKKITSMRDRQNDPAALEIYQANLDAVSKAIMSGNIDSALDHLRAPYYMRTSKGLETFNNAQDIRDGINSARLSLRVQGATDFVRTAHHAYFRSATEIEGLHSTRVLRNNELMTPPYENRMKLVRSPEGLWQVIHAEHANVVEGWSLLTPKDQEQSLADLEPLTQADEIARMVYQEYLDALTTTNLTHNFDEWVAMCRFPHVVKIDHVTRNIEHADDIRQFFDMISGMVRDNPKATFKRHGEFATFIDSHTIKGYHRTTFTDGTNAVFNPVRGRFTIVLHNGRWCMTETVNSIANTEFPYAKPIVSDAIGSEKDLKK